jgi:hypothetical protein
MSQMKLMDVNIKSFYKLSVILGIGLLTGFALVACSKKSDQTRVSNHGEYKGEYILETSGYDPMGDLVDTLDLLYKEESDHRDIAEGILKTIWKDMFGGSVSLFSMLDLFDQEYSLALKEGEDNSLLWVITLRTHVEKNELEKHLNKLHSGFASVFPLGVIRTRELPSGKVFKDIVPDTEGVVLDEWKESGFRASSSNHMVSGNRLIHAIKGNLLIVSNNEDLLRSAIKDQPDMEDRSLYVSKVGFKRLSALFPTSDVLSFLRNSVNKDSLLSLSSWSCVP